MNLEIEDFKQVQEELSVCDTAAAILVLANRVSTASATHGNNMEIFGHELAMALKNVLQCEQLRVEMISPIEIRKEDA